MPVIVRGAVTVMGDNGPATPVSVKRLPGVELDTFPYEYVTEPPLSVQLVYGSCEYVTGAPLTVTTVPVAEPSSPECAKVAAYWVFQVATAVLAEFIVIGSLCE